jgi:spore coat protein U-like protein
MGHAVQSAFREVCKYVDKVEASWNAGELSWAETKEGIISVAATIGERHGVEVLATLTKGDSSYLVTVQIAGGKLSVTCKRKLPADVKLTKEAQARVDADARRAGRYKPTPSHLGADPEVS